MRWKWILGILTAAILAVFIAIVMILSTYDFNKLKPRITGIAGEYTGRELKIAGDIDLAITLYPTLVVSDIAFQNAAWGSRLNMVTVERVEIQVALLPLIRGEVRVENLRLVKPDCIIEVDKTGKNNMEFEVPEKSAADAQKEEPEDQVAAFFGFKDITMKDGMVTFYDHRDKSKNILIVQECVREAADFRAESEMRFVGSYNDYPIKVQGKIGSLVNIFDPAQKWSLDLSVEAFESHITVTGSILDVKNLKGIDLKLAAKGEDLTRFEKSVQKSLPVKAPFSVSAHLVAFTGDQFKVSDISLLLGNSEISGSVAIDQSARKPNINAKLISETLDLRPVIDRAGRTESDALKSTPASQKKSDNVFPNTPLRLEGLHQINAEIDFKAKQVLLAKIALDNFKTRTVLKDGHFTVDPLAAQIGGGRLDSHLDLLAQDNQAIASMKVNVKKLDIGKMLKKLAITDDLDGMLDLDINLTGQGDSVAALMAGLNGDVVAILGEGKMPVEYFNLVGVDFTSSLMRLINPFSEKIDRATINCAVCDFHIKDGLAKTDVLMLDDPQKTLISDGKIDLKTERLDFGIKTKPKEGIGTQQTGKLSISFSDITKPFKLGGTLANPSLEIDVAGAATTIGAALLGPAGWAYLLLSGSSGKKTPCEAAIEVAGEGTPKMQEKSGADKEQQVAGEKKKERLGSKIKSLFSTDKE